MRMSKRQLLHALEEVCSEVDETEDTFGDEMLAIMEASNELDSKIVDLDKDFGVMDEIDASIERLEGIRDAIIKYGISRPMMEAVDPKGELIEVGICCSYEDLSNIPVMDVQADATLEGIKDAIGTTMKHLKNFVKMIGHKFKDIGIAFRKSFSMFDAILTKYSKIVKDIKVDEEKFAKEEIRTCSKDDFEGTVKALNELFKIVNVEEASAIGALATELVMRDKDNSENILTFRKKISAYFQPLVGNKEIEEYLGITVKHNSEEHLCDFVHDKSKKISDKRKTAAAAGWSASDVNIAVTSALGLLDNVDKMVNLGDKLFELCEKLGMISGEYHNEYAANVNFRELKVNVEHKTVMDYGRLLSSLNDFITACWDIYSAAIHPLDQVCSSALQLARAADKCKVK